MITWMDFVFDDVVGPVLAVPDGDLESRGTRHGRPSVMDDAGKKGVVNPTSFQETRQEQRPARMAGLSGLDSIARTDMEVGGSDRTRNPRRRGEG